MKKLNSKDKMAAFFNILKKVTASVASFCRMRHRYVFTKKNNLRLRYITSLSVFVIAAMASFGALIPHSEAHYGNVDELFANASDVIQNVDQSKAILDGSALGSLSLASMTARSIPHPSSRIVTIEPGDALSVVLEREGVGEDTPKTIKALSEHFDPRGMRAGDKIYLAYAPNDSGESEFEALKIKLDPLRTVIVKRGDEGFESNIDEKSVDRVVHAKKAVIENSLFGSSEKAGIPRGIVAEAMRIYSWNVDFQRDIRKGDTLEVMYETFETSDGYVAKSGNVLYANLSLRGQEIPLYRFEMNDGRVDYFQPNGRSMKRTLMKTPIDGARLSSGYGLRTHPVLGYKKMHKGVDFAAPTGTPIYAAGDGVIEKAGWFSSYGKYVRIRHNSELKTAYAHLSRIKVKNGTRIQQGDVIGYVGTTGRSTGPHLHYEVLLHGKQTNPRSVNLPTGERLAGNELTQFKEKSKEISRKFASLFDNTRVASRSVKKDSKLN